MKIIDWFFGRREEVQTQCRLGRITKRPIENLNEGESSNRLLKLLRLWSQQKGIYGQGGNRQVQMVHLGFGPRHGRWFLEEEERQRRERWACTPALPPWRRSERKQLCKSGTVWRSQVRSWWECWLWDANVSSSDRTGIQAVCMGARVMVNRAVPDRLNCSGRGGSGGESPSPRWQWDMSGR